MPARSSKSKPIRPWKNGNAFGGVLVCVYNALAIVWKKTNTTNTKPIILLVPDSIGSMLHAFFDTLCVAALEQQEIFFLLAMKSIQQYGQQFILLLEIAVHLLEDFEKSQSRVVGSHAGTP